MCKRGNFLVSPNAVRLNLTHNSVAWEMLVATQQEYHILMSNRDYITVEISNATHGFCVNANIEFLATVWDKGVGTPHDPTSKRDSRSRPTTAIGSPRMFLWPFPDCRLSVPEAAFCFHSQSRAFNCVRKPWLNGDLKMACGLTELSLDRTVTSSPASPIAELPTNRPSGCLIWLSLADEWGISSGGPVGV